MKSKQKGEKSDPKENQLENKEKKKQWQTQSVRSKVSCDLNSGQQSYLADFQFVQTIIYYPYVQSISFCRLDYRLSFCVDCYFCILFQSADYNLPQSFALCRLPHYAVYTTGYHILQTGILGTLSTSAVYSAEYTIMRTITLCNLALSEISIAEYQIVQTVTLCKLNLMQLILQNATLCTLSLCATCLADMIWAKNLSKLDCRLAHYARGCIVQTALHFIKLQ